jgi:hypothetical protein
MSVFSMPAPRPAPDAELEQIAQLAVSLSGRLARFHLNDIASVIAEVLEEIAVATAADRCELVEFTTSGSVLWTYMPVNCTHRVEAVSPTLRADHWLVERLVRGESVVITRPDDLPRDAMMVIDLDPRAALSWANQATVLPLSRRYAEAEAIQRRALELRPWHGPALLELALM